MINNIQVLHTYEYYDGPLIFLGVYDNNKYLCWYWNEEEDYSEWLLVPITDDQIGLLECGKISYSDMALKPEIETLLILQEHEDGHNSIRFIEYNELIDLLPTENFYVEYVDG